MKEDILLKLASAFKQNKYELYLVGGAIRDEILNLTPPEFDMTTNAKPPEIKKILSSLKPKNLYTVGEKYGTISADFKGSIGECAFEAKTDSSQAKISKRDDVYKDTLSGGAFKNLQPEESVCSQNGIRRSTLIKVEITTFRSELYTPGSRHPEVLFGYSIEEDLSRRDFTINAIAKNMNSGEIIDPYNGRQDIAQKLIRLVGDSPDRFKEDPLRLLRAIRFAVALDFTIEEKTAAYIKKNAPELASISSERIAQEMDKILIAPKPSLAIKLITELDLIPYILPEFIALQNVKHEYDEHKNIYEHTLTVLDRVTPNKRLRWIALLHDIAKPQTKNLINGKIHFFQHELVGERMARQILTRLHYDHNFIKDTTKLIRMHLRANLYVPSWNDGAVKRLMREAGELLDDLITFSYADITSARVEKVAQGHKRIDEFAARIEKIRQKEEVEKYKSPLSGDDLMKLFNRPAGPWIQPIKNYLLDLVIDGKLKQNDKKTASELAKQFLSKK